MRRLLVTLLFCIATMAQADTKRILVQSTTSTENSGLYTHLFPPFEAATGYDVQVVAVGTGQAIRNARNGDADLLITHARPLEDAFIADGHGLERHDLMYNDFVLIGPAEDPADVTSANSATEALSLVAAAEALFISRGDESGTHLREKSLWAASGSSPTGAWYRETGSGMGATIRMAVETGGYTLADRGTWLAYNAPGDTKILYEGDPPLNNQYSLIVLDPARHTHINIEGAKALRDWLLGPDGQSRIASFMHHNAQLFTPNATK